MSMTAAVPRCHLSPHLFVNKRSLVLLEGRIAFDQPLRHGLWRPRLYIVCKCMHVCMYACLYVCMYVRVCVIHTHTTHTHARTHTHMHKYMPTEHIREGLVARTRAHTHTHPRPHL